MSKTMWRVKVTVLQVVTGALRAGVFWMSHTFINACKGRQRDQGCAMEHLNSKIESSGSVFFLSYIYIDFMDRSGKPWKIPFNELILQINLKDKSYMVPFCFTGHRNLAHCHKLFSLALQRRTVTALPAPTSRAQTIKWLISLFFPLSVSLFIKLRSQKQHDISSFASVLPPHVQSLLPSSRSMVEIWHGLIYPSEFLI